MQQSLLFEPLLKHFPIKLTMIIAPSLLGFTRQQRSLDQRVFLHRVHETPASSFPTQPLDTIMFGTPGILPSMMVMQKTLIDRADTVSLSRGQVTILSDFIEIIMPVLAHCRFLSQGARSVFRP